MTITRTLFRSGESEYAINGAQCRLLDVQELLSDTGVGRQQHVIVGQGQLDSVLASRPEDRRMVIEEAAGVLKFRRRRERAMRRLEASEANVNRLSDLLREVRRQLRPLERQAASAHLHAELSTELEALRRYLSGRELAALAGAERTATSRLAELTEQGAALSSRRDDVDASVAEAESELGTEGDDGLGALVARVEQLSERSRGLVGATELALMRPSAYLINTSRGPIVDEGALIDALAAGRIAGAGLDVYDTEPLPVEHPLRTTANTLLLPHVGYVTTDTYKVFYGDAVEDILAWAGGAAIRVLSA